MKILVVIFALALFLAPGLSYADTTVYGGSGTGNVSKPASPTDGAPVCWDGTDGTTKDCANLTDSAVTGLDAATVVGYTADASPTGDDLVVTVNDPGGTAALRKVTVTNLLALITQGTLHIDDLLTALGVASGATHFGTFTGSTIPDNQTGKAAIQALETAVEGKAATNAATTVNGQSCALGSTCTVTAVGTNLQFGSDAQDDIAVRGASAYGRLNITEQTLVGRITGGHIAALSTAQIKTLLGYPTSGEYQPSDADLTAIAALSCTENQIIKRNGAGAWVCAADETGAGGSFSVTDITGQTDDTTPATTATAVLAQGGSLIESTLGQIATAIGVVDWTADQGATNIHAGNVPTPTAITVADTTDTTSYVALFESATGDLGPKTDAGITYNAGTGVLTATGFAGPLTGNVTGNCTGTAGGLSGTPNVTVGTVNAGGGGFTVDADGDAVAKSLTTAASATPTVLLNDSDAPGTDKEIGKVVGAYVDGADGSENGTVDINVHQAGTTTSYIQADGKNVQVEINKPLVIFSSDDPDLSAASQMSYDTDGWIRIYSTSQKAIARIQEEIHVTVYKPNDMDDAQRDHFWIWSNESGMSFVVTGWKGWSTSDDTTLTIYEEDADGANDATVDAVEIATGAGPYTGSDTTITGATVETGHLLYLDFDDTDTPAMVKITIYGYYNADVN